MRERIVFSLMVFILIMLFAILFYVLGKGEYQATADPWYQPVASSTLTGT